MKRVGTRIQVMHGNAKQTGGGLKKKDLKYNKHGKIVSKKASAVATKKMKGGGTNKLKYEMKGGDSFDVATYTLTGRDTHMNVNLCKIPSKGSRILSLSRYHLIRINILNIILSLNMGPVDIITQRLTGTTTYGRDYTLTHTRELRSEIPIRLPAPPILRGEYDHQDIHSGTIEGINGLIFFKLLCDLVTTKYQGEYDKRRELFDKFYSDRTTLISIHNTNEFFDTLKRDFTTMKSRKSGVYVPDYNVIVPIMHYYIFAVNNNFIESLPGPVAAQRQMPPPVSPAVASAAAFRKGFHKVGPLAPTNLAASSLASAPSVSMRTSNVAKYQIGQHVTNMGPSGIEGHIISIVADNGITGATGPGTITILPVSASVSMRTSNVAKYHIGQHVINMGPSGIEGHIISIVADNGITGATGPGTIIILPVAVSPAHHERLPRGISYRYNQTNNGLNSAVRQMESLMSESIQSSPVVTRIHNNQEGYCRIYSAVTVINSIRTVNGYNIIIQGNYNKSTSYTSEYATITYNFNLDIQRNNSNNTRNGIIYYLFFSTNDAITSLDVIKQIREYKIFDYYSQKIIGIVTGSRGAPPGSRVRLSPDEVNTAEHTLIEHFRTDTSYVYCTINAVSLNLRSQGSHAIVINGYDQFSKKFKIKNNWARIEQDRNLSELHLYNLIFFKKKL